MQPVMELAQMALAETRAFTESKGRDAAHKVMYLDQSRYNQVREYQRQVRKESTNDPRRVVNNRFFGYQLFAVNNSPSHVRIITE